MADQTIEIRLVLRDELSRQLAPINAQLRHLANTRVDAAHAGFQRLAPAVRVVHRELSTLSRLTLGGLVGGGVVAGIAAAVRAMQDMARQQIQLHYTAQQLGVSQKFIENYRDALTGLGEAPEGALAAIKQALSTLDEFQVKGEKSSLGKFLEESIGGPAVAARLRQVIAKQGQEAGLEFLISYSRGIKDRRGQAEFLKQAGLPFAAKDVAEILPLLGKRVQLSTEQMKALAIANMQYQRSANNISLILSSALVPGLTKVIKALSDYLQTESGKKFAAELKQWSDRVGEAIAKWIREGGLKKEIDGIKQAVGELTAAFDQANVVITAIGTEWKEFIEGVTQTPFVQWLTDVADALGLIPSDAANKVSLLERAAEAMKRLLGGQFTREQELTTHDPITGQPLFSPLIPSAPQGPIQPFTPRFVPQGVPRAQPQRGEGKPETEQERRAAQAADERERDALNRELKQLAESTGHLADYLQIGGPEGTADGRSGFQLGNVGGVDISTLTAPKPSRDKYTPPVLPAPATPIRKTGSIFSGISEGLGFGSWFGNLPGWTDRADKPGSNALNVPEREQGISLSNKSTLGQYFYVTDPNTGLTSVQRQTDRGPGIRTGKLVDVSAAMAERLGYTPKTFPTGKGLWNIENTGFGTGRTGFGGNAWAGRSGGFDELGGVGAGAPPSSWDEAGFSSITNQIAQANGGGGERTETNVSPITQMLAGQDRPISGSATVDIDVGGLGGGERNLATLFKPQPMDGAVQMQNAHHVPDNRLSFQ